jgi:hypothetical protein
MPLLDETSIGDLLKEGVINWYMPFYPYHTLLLDA